MGVDIPYVFTNKDLGETYLISASVHFYGLSIQLMISLDKNNS